MAFIERTEKDVRFHGFLFWDDVKEKKIISVKCINEKLIISDTPSGHRNEMIFYISPITENRYLWNLLWVVNEENKYTAFQSISVKKPFTYFQSIINASDEEIEKLLNESNPKKEHSGPNG